MTIVQQSLFGSETAAEKVSRRKSYRKRANAEAARFEAIFDTWWRTWPVSPSDVKAQALTVWMKLANQGVPIPEFERQLANLLEARALFKAQHGQEPPRMRAATFLNSKRKLWDEPWTAAQATGYWSACLPKVEAETWSTQWAIGWELWTQGGSDYMVRFGPDRGLSRRSFRAFHAIAQALRGSEQGAKFAFKAAYEAQRNG